MLMIKTNFARTFLPVIVAALTLAACGKSEEPSLLTSKETLLRYVPAETPYVFASIEPLPDDLMDKLEPKLDRLLKAYQTVLREAIAMKQQEGGEQADSEEAKRFSAVADELLSMLSLEGLRGAGIDRDSTAALYGNGLLPVLRATLSDGALFDGAIARLEKEAGQSLSVASIDGHDYRYVDIDKFRIIIAVIDDQAVVTLRPVDGGDDELRSALGLKLPGRSIADSGVLLELARQYGFTEHYAGLLDIERVAATFLDEASGPDAELLAAMDHDATELSDDCRAEMRSMAGIAPRIVFGYNAVSASRLDSSVIFELRDDIAAGLATLPAPVPGLGGDKGGLMSFGLSLNVQAARAFVEARVNAIQAEPYKCEHFADIQEAATNAKQGLSQPVPPIMYDFRGLLAIIDDIQGMDIATQTPPTSVDGQLLLAVQNAQGLVALGAMFSPELAQLNLQPDGKPVALDLPQLQGMGVDAYAAMTDDVVAIGVGENAAAKLAGMLQAKPSDPPPFASFSFDAARYYAFLGDAIAAAEPGDDEPEASPEMKAAVNDIMGLIAELYDRMVLEVLVTAHGAEIHSSVTLKD
jgi:hypothetical protein